MMKIFIVSLLFLTALVNLVQARVGCDVAKPCQNGGTCQNNGRCNCRDIYFGEFCQYNNSCYRQCPNDTQCVRYGDTTKCEEIPCMNVADIGIVLDCSGSINKRNFRIMLATVKTFIDHFKLGADRIQMALFAFNDSISTRQIELNELNDNKAFLEEMMKFGKEHTGGGTRTDKAIYHLMDMFNETRGDRPDAPNMGFLFTDGKSNLPKKTEEAAKALHADRPDINMFCIGIGSGVDVKELEIIASKKENVIITDFRKLPEIVEKLVNKTCVKNPCSNNPCKNNGVCIVVLDSFICDCPSGYSGERCMITCDTHYDVIIVFDESGSISKRKFNQMIDGVLYFVKGLDIDSGKVRVGIITYATNIFIAFDLDTFHDKVHMIFVIDLLRYKYRGGLTNTHKALRYLIKYGYTASKGDRKYVPNYTFIITDGKSRKPWLTKKYAWKLQQMKVYMYALGVGRNVNKREIFYLASKPKRHHMFFSSFAKIPINILRVKVEVCADFTPTEHCMRCRGPRQCPPCMQCCKGCCRDKVTLLS